MADILERKIPYLFPDDLELRLDAQNFVTAISGYPVGGGGGTIVESDFIWKPVINQDGTIGWVRDTSATTPATANLVPHIYNNYWYIGTSNTNVEARGSQGEPGDKGDKGDKGDTGAKGEQGIQGPKGDTGEQGPQGIQGPKGDTGEQGPQGEAGAKGDKGDKGNDGVSPAVTVTNIPADPDDPDHKNGGTEITITDATSTNKFSAWNGNDGTMAGAPGIEGNKGISATLDGSTYKVGLSAGFYSAVTSVSSKLNESDFTTYTATTAPGAFQPKGNYASASDISDMATQTWVSQQNYLTSVPSEYITESELSTTLADYMQSVLTGTGLSGDGSTTALGIDTAAAINFTNASAKSATSAVYANIAKGDHTDYNLGSTLDTMSNITAAINTSLEYMTGYNGIERQIDETTDYVSAFGLTDSAYSAVQYVTANSSKFVFSGSNISGDKQYVLTSGGWQEVQGGLTSVSANSPISGNGTNATPLGLDMTDAYTIDGTNGITAVPDATTNKVVVQMTNDVYQDVQHLHTSASEWDKISGLSAKSNVNITSAGVTTVTNASGTTENKFTQYAEVASHPTPRMFLCATADTVEDITSVLTAASGMGAIVFVIESHS